MDNVGVDTGAKGRRHGRQRTLTRAPIGRRSGANASDYAGRQNRHRFGRQRASTDVNTGVNGRQWAPMGVNGRRQARQRASTRAPTGSGCATSSDCHQRHKSVGNDAAVNETLETGANSFTDASADTGANKRRLGR